jgi:hypothetical protein
MALNDCSCKFIKSQAQNITQLSEDVLHGYLFTYSICTYYILYIYILLLIYKQVFQ